MKNQKEDTMIEGLEEAIVATDATAEKKVKKEQTPEEKETLVAGVALMGKLGVSDKLAKVMSLIADWNGDKDALSTKKESVIKEFGGSESLKDYIDGDFQEEVKAFQGIAKAMPVLNNIKAFYARRENTGTKKVKTVQISISGVLYNVDATYAAEIQGLPAVERKELLLKHPVTAKADVIDEII